MFGPQKNRTIVFISLFTIIVSIAVMAGWIFHVPALQQIVPGFVSMVFNTALCFVLFGLALLLTQYRAGTFSNLAFFVLSLAGALTGIITLLQFLFHFNTGLDQLFVNDSENISADHLYAGRMAFNAAINVSLFGLGLLMLTARKKVFNLIAQCLFHAVTFLSAMALVGYLYGASLFYSLFYVSSMATHTAVLFFILSVAASLLNPSIGITKMFTGSEIGNRMGKRLYILMLIPILMFGSLRVQTQHLGFFSLEVGISLLAVSVLLVSLLLIWDTANRLNKIDAQRTAAEAEIKLINADLEKRVEERTAESKKNEEKYHSLIEQASDAIYVLDTEMNFTDVNASMCKMMGYARDELLKMNVRDIIDPEELKTDPLLNLLENPDIPVFRERSFMRKDGSVFPVEVNVKVFPGRMVMVMARDITERKRIEAEHLEAENIILKEKMLSDTIINSLPGSFYLFNDQGKYLRWNANFETITGYSVDEIEHLDPMSAIAPEDREMVQEAIGKVYEEGYALVEANALTKDGVKIPMLLTGIPILYEGQRCLLGMGIDISSRRKAEAELRSSEQKYKLLFESNPLPLWMIAKDSLSIIAVNDAAAKLYGYTQEELLNNNIRIFRPEEDWDKQLEGYQRNITTSTDTGVIRHIKKDGTEMFVQIIAHDIIFDGRPVRLSLTNDITERLKAEEALKKSEANLQTILNTTDTAYALFDIDLAVLAFNQKAMEFVKAQYHHKPAKGDKLADYFPAERFPKFLDFTKEVLTGNHISYEVDYAQPSGAIFWYDVSLSPIINDRKEILGMLMALYDITERKNAEHNLKDAYGRIQSQINSIKGMAWKQSHLMRSPLANLKALAGLLKEHPADTESLAHFQTELDRLDAIIHEMAQDASDHVI